MSRPILVRVLQGSKNIFCASCRIFRAEPGCHFSGRIFFQLGRNRALRIKSLGAMASSFLFAFFAMKIDEKPKKKNYLKEVGPTSFL